MAVNQENRRPRTRVSHAQDDLTNIDSLVFESVKTRWHDTRIIIWHISSSTARVYLAGSSTASAGTDALKRPSVICDLRAIRPRIGRQRGQGTTRRRAARTRAAPQGHRNTVRLGNAVWQDFGDPLGTGVLGTGTSLTG